MSELDQQNSVNEEAQPAPIFKNGFSVRRIGVAVGSRYVFTTLALIIMGISGALLLHSAYLMRSSVGSLIEIMRRREATSSFLSYLKDTERGQRGFLLTGSDSYLQPYVVGKSSAMQSLARMRLIHEKEDSWKEVLDRVSELTAAKFSEMDNALEIRREHGLEAAIVLVKTDEGKRLMEDITLTMMQMNIRETNILSMDKYNQWAIMTEAIVGFSVSNLLVLSLMVVTLLMIESRRKLAIEQAKVKSGINRQLTELKNIELGEVSGADAISKLRQIHRDLSDITTSSAL